jgi:hypothetical protein
VYRLSSVAVLCLFSAALLTAAPAPEGPSFVFVELKEQVNHKMKDDFHSGNYPGNNLTVPTGKQAFDGIKFQIGDGVVQLGSSNVAGKPEKVEGIKIGTKCQKLHFLHATGYRAEDDTVIAKYVVQYDDKTSETVEVVYGKDVVDWWAYPDQKGPSMGKAVWEGENEASKKFEAKIKLYLKTWENPHPKKKVVGLDFIGTAAESGAAPFIVAITAEE